MAQIPQQWSTSTAHHPSMHHRVYWRYTRPHIQHSNWLSEANITLVDLARSGPLYAQKNTLFRHFTRLTLCYPLPIISCMQSACAHVRMNDCDSSFCQLFFVSRLPNKGEKKSVYLFFLAWVDMIGLNRGLLCADTICHAASCTRIDSSDSQSKSHHMHSVNRAIDQLFCAMIVVIDKAHGHVLRRSDNASKTNEFVNNPEYGVYFWQMILFLFSIALHGSLRE